MVAKRQKIQRFYFVVSLIKGSDMSPFQAPEKFVEFINNKILLLGEFLQGSE